MQMQCFEQDGQRSQRTEAFLVLNCPSGGWLFQQDPHKVFLSMQIRLVPFALRLVQLREHLSPMHR